jgi:large subunit ribosomal protein L20
MSRVKSGVVTHARHRKVIKKAAGYYAARSTNFRTATQAVDKAQQYATRDRKARKRQFRALWIQRINAAVDLAVHEPEAFNAIAAQAKAALA